MFTSDTKRFLSSAAFNIKVKKVFGFMVVAGFLSGLTPSTAFAADTASAPAATIAPMSRPQIEIAPGVKPQAELSREEWHKAMIQLPHPKKGCFKATHPKVEWQEVPCGKAPDRPYPPTRKAKPLPNTVGGGGTNDVSAQVTGNLLSAEGSFDSVTGVTSETDSLTGQANQFSLQLNTKPFTTSVCSGAAIPANCQGWQQFLYSSGYNIVWMQYWLINYGSPGAACPAGWLTYAPHCYTNSPTTSVPAQTIASLTQLRLAGSANATTDTATLTTGGGTIHSTNQDSVLNLANHWQIAEFNIFGDGNGSSANFNNGSTLIVRTIVQNGTTNAPTCVNASYTGETNNLSFGPTAPAASQPGPAIIFMESSAGGAASSCAAATAVGDTHLTTFGGLHYDFQAAGDFVLAQSDSGFVVQTRQVSAKPTWPDASLNSAVATRMGRTKIALCIAPAGNTAARLVIDGKITNLADGKSLELPSGVDVSRKGNVYLMIDPEGNSVHAVVNSINANANNWIDVDVGLGHWPAKVSGLLANPSGNANALEARDGTVLAMPVSFADLYGRYGDSWRVQPNESLLSACGGKKIERGNPRKPFYASDLKPKDYERARATCIQAGVKEGVHLDDCTLDVAVIGHKAATKVFVGRRVPLAVMPKLDLKVRLPGIDERLPNVIDRR